MSKNSTTIFINKSLLGGTGQFTKEIRVPFIVKTITINNLFYNNLNADPQETVFSVLSTDILNTLDGVIATFFDGYRQSNPMTFPCNKQINGLVNFYYTSSPALEGGLSFALTFED